MYPWEIKAEEKEYLQTKNKLGALSKDWQKSIFIISIAGKWENELDQIDKNYLA